MYKKMVKGIQDKDDDSTIIEAARKMWYNSLPKTEKNIRMARYIDQNMGGRRRTRRTHRTRRTKHKRRTSKRTN